MGLKESGFSFHLFCASFVFLDEISINSLQLQENGGIRMWKQSSIPQCKLVLPPMYQMRTQSTAILDHSQIVLQKVKKKLLQESFFKPLKFKYQMLTSRGGNGCLSHTHVRLIEPNQFESKPNSIILLIGIKIWNIM